MKKFTGIWQNLTSAPEKNREAFCRLTIWPVLKLKSCHSKLTKCPYEAAFLAAGGIGGTMSNIDYANSLIPTMRSWSETVFRTALEGRVEDDINQIVDRFYDAYRDEVAANPSGHAMDYIHIVLDIQKRT